jgi:hypothetical protein
MNHGRPCSQGSHSDGFTRSGGRCRVARVRHRRVAQSVSRRQRPSGRPSGTKRRHREGGEDRNPLMTAKAVQGPSGVLLPVHRWRALYQFRLAFVPQLLELALRESGPCCRFNRRKIVKESQDCLFFFLALAHRAFAAFLARSFLSSAVRAAMRFFPPLPPAALPPFLPISRMTSEIRSRRITPSYEERSAAASLDA